MKFINKLIRLFNPPERVEYPNLFAQLCNVRTAYDLASLDTDQLTMLYANSVQLVESVLGEMERRDMDVNRLLDVTRNSIASNDFRKAP